MVSKTFVTAAILASYCLLASAIPTKNEGNIFAEVYLVFGFVITSHFKFQNKRQALALLTTSLDATLFPALSAAMTTSCASTADASLFQLCWPRTKIDSALKSSSGAAHKIQTVAMRSTNATCFLHLI